MDRESGKKGVTRLAVRWMCQQHSPQGGRHERELDGIRRADRRCDPGLAGGPNCTNAHAESDHFDPPRPRRFERGLEEVSCGAGCICGNVEGDRSPASGDARGVGAVIGRLDEAPGGRSSKARTSSGVKTSRCIAGLLLWRRAEDQWFFGHLLRAKALAFGLDPRCELGAWLAAFPSRGYLPQVIRACSACLSKRNTPPHIRDVCEQVHGQISSHELDIVSSVALDHLRLAHG